MRWRSVGHGHGRTPGLGLALAVLPLFFGCGAVFQPPTVRVAEVRLGSMSLSGGTLRVSLEVDNPNRYALESRDFGYVLSFADGAGGEAGWVTLAEGSVEETVRVEGGQVGRVAVDVPFSAASVGAALGRLLRQGELEYRFSGVLLAGTPMGARRIPFDERGRFRP